MLFEASRAFREARERICSGKLERAGVEGLLARPDLVVTTVVWIFGGTLGCTSPLTSEPSRLVVL